MLSRADRLGAGARLVADVCIVGAGPAGITLARELGGHGIDVLVLESGGLRSDVRSHRLTRGPTVGETYHRLWLSRDRGLGGTSLRFHLEDEGWRARPLDPIDLEAREEIPHSGWPIAYAELDRYLARAHVAGDLGPPTYDPAALAPPGSAPPLPLDPQEAETTVFQLGRHDFAIHRAELAASTDVRVLLRATVAEIVTDVGGRRVDHLVVARPDGQRFRVQAPIVVLAGGAIDNARLLLLSDRHASGGIGNRHDVVGRFFMERMVTRAGFVVANDPSLMDRVGLYGIQRAGPVNLEGVVRLPDPVLRREGLLNGLMSAKPRSRAFMSEGVRSAGNVTKLWRRWPLPPDLPAHAANMARGARALARVAMERSGAVAVEDPVLMLRTQHEQSPNPASRVTVSRRRDHLGIPLPQLEWRTTPRDHTSLARSADLVGKAFESAGIARVGKRIIEQHPRGIMEGAWHHMGTTRMSDDPRTGVVDRDSRVHGVDGLYVAGSSVFPTSGASNPTLTILQLALRLADHLRQVA